MIVHPIIKYKTLGIAKSIVPVDTGNLKYNAIKITRNRPSKWTINYSSKEANYLEYVNDGTRNQRGQRFVNDAVGMIAYYLTREFNNENPHFPLKSTKEEGKNTLRRDMRNMRSNMLYNEKKKLERG